MLQIQDDTTSVENFSSHTYNFISKYVKDIVDIPKSVEDILYFKLFDNLLIDWVAALFIFATVYFFRKQLIKFLEYLLRLVSKEFKNPLGLKFVKIFHNPLKWKILLIGFSASYAVLNFSDSTNEIYFEFTSSANTILIGWVLLLFVDFLHNFYTHRYDTDGIVNLQDTVMKFAITIAKVIIVVVVFVVLLQTWGYDIRGLLASLGLVGMAIALAAKDSARHIFGSIMIFSDKPFKVGDWIKTPEVEGTIEDIGMRSTKVRTFAQALVAVPNGNLADSAILNWSKMGKRRIKLTIGLTYSTTSTQMQNILNDIREFLQNDDDIHQDTIHIYFNEFANSSLGVFCYFFTKTTNWGEYMRVKERVYLEFMKIVENNGASFAFPSQSIYMEQNDKNNNLATENIS